jgi:hypothetical protein
METTTPSVLALRSLTLTSPSFQVLSLNEIYESYHTFETSQRCQRALLVQVMQQVKTILTPMA